MRTANKLARLGIEGTVRIWRPDRAPQEKRKRTETQEKAGPEGGVVARGWEEVEEMGEDDEVPHTAGPPMTLSCVGDTHVTCR